MKIILFISLLLTLLTLALPIFITSGGASISEAEVKSDISPELSIKDESQITVEAEQKSLTDIDTGVEVRLLTNDRVEVLNMHDYLVGVVAAEMPASFNNEALKAQAVAARTYTLYKMHISPNHVNADVCDDPMCCKAYLSFERLEEKWKDKYDFNIYIIKNAVIDTDGLYLSYESEPIFAAFHSSSSGYTENCENVFTKSLPYLISVQSPENENVVPNYKSELQISYENIKYTVLAAYPEAEFSNEPEQWFTNTERSEAGRVINVTVGGVKLSGTQFRTLFGLRSAAIEWQTEDEGIRFVVTGYGHGVGMSQYGANEFAKNGAKFVDILTYYYKDTEIKVYDDEVKGIRTQLHSAL